MAKRNDYTLDTKGREITMVRTFYASRKLVFKAYTDPKAIPLWWGPRYLTTTVHIMDVRPGGLWRFFQRDQKGNTYTFNGEYKEVIVPEKIINTFEFEAMPGHIILETVTFEEEGGNTVVTSKSLFQSDEDLHGMVQSGMEEGAAESWDHLAELLNLEIVYVVESRI